MCIKTVSLFYIEKWNEWCERIKRNSNLFSIITAYCNPTVLLTDSLSRDFTLHVISIKLENEKVNSSMPSRGDEWWNTLYMWNIIKMMDFWDPQAL
jgi:hypothetical protein